MSQETGRWSEENMKQARLENLAKGRETLKKKRENSGGSKMPFTVNPINENPTIATDSDERKQSENARAEAGRRGEENNSRQQDAGGKSWLLGQICDFSYGLFFTLSSVAFTMALPIMVDGIRGAILQRNHAPTLPTTSKSGKDDSNTFNAGDIMF